MTKKEKKTKKKKKKKKKKTKRKKKKKKKKKKGRQFVPPQGRPWARPSKVLLLLGGRSTLLPVGCQCIEREKRESPSHDSEYSGLARPAIKCLHNLITWRHAHG